MVIQRQLRWNKNTEATDPVTTTFYLLVINDKRAKKRINKELKKH